LTLRFFAPTFVGEMSSAGESENTSARPSVFLSYASEDRTAATKIRDAMAAAGLDVWYDENELGGGDAWDKKIRQQIRECDYFMALVSARTEARHEGYFRREWRLAVERTLDMVDDHPFILPVAIDNTDQASAKVPEKFLAVQWLKVPDGQPTPGLAALFNRLLSGTMTAKPAPRRTPVRTPGAAAAPPPFVMPAFPIEEPGQKVKFWFHVTGWSIKSAWFGFKRLPRWIRALVIVWVLLGGLSKSCSRDKPAGAPLSAETSGKLKAIAEKYEGSAKNEDVAKLGLDIAREFAKEVGDVPSGTKPFLAVPFRAAAGDTPEAKLANSTFALLYGRLSVSRQGQVGLSKEPLASMDPRAASDLGHANHATYVIFGEIETASAGLVLSVEIVRVSDGSIAWSKSYPIAESDPTAISAEIEAKVPTVDDN
jgi:TolB-like protein